MLREVGKTAGQQKRVGGWLSSLTSLTTAPASTPPSAGQHRKVLEEGEELLVRHAGDLKIQMTLARPPSAWD